MTGYQSKKAAASAKTIDEVNWVDHEPDGRRAAAQDKLQCQCSMSTKLVGSGCQYCNPEYLDDDDVHPPQRTWVELTDEEIEQRIGYRLPAYGFDAIRQLIKENT